MIKWISSLASAMLFIIVLGAVARLLWALLQLGWLGFGLF
jgi:hypothetical protein